LPIDFALILMLVALPLLLIASAFFSGSETALFSLTKHERARLARSPSLAAHAVTQLLAETRSLLITLLMGNMTINVLYFVISSVVLIRLSKQEWVGPLLLAVMSVAPLLTIIMLGEVLPKIVASRHRLPWTKLLGIPLLVVHRTIAPIRAIAQVLVITPLARLIAPKQKPAALSEAELESLLKLSRHHGVIDNTEERLLQQVLELSQLKVRDLMTPRVDIIAHDLNESTTELTDMVLSKRLKHIPVYRDEIDQIQGLVYARQVLLRRPQSSEQVERIVRQVRFVPEQQRADQLLIEMRKTGTTFCIVVDEYGGTAGLITLEDSVEHMVGDLPGGFEQRGEAFVEKLSEHQWRADGELSIHDWPDVFGTHALLGSKADIAGASTLGGLVMSTLGRVPEPNDVVELGNVRMTVETMVGRRVSRVLIELTAPPTPGDTPSREVSS